jgi:hypothetical protein
MGKYKDQLQELRTRAERLPLDVTMLGWFGQATPQDRFVPVGKLHCVSIARGHFTRAYTKLNLTTQPAIVMVAPAIWQEGMVHVGGGGWWQRPQGGEFVYTRERVHDAKPVGVVRDVFEPSPFSPMGFKPFFRTDEGVMDRRIVKWVLRLLDDQTVQAQPGYGRWGDTEVIPPAFLCPALRSHPLRLRQGPALERLIRHCAEYGQWAIREDASKVGELRTSVRGLAHRVDESDIHFVGDDPEQGKLEDRYSAHRASKQVEDLISEIFHVDMGVALMPLVPTEGARVKEGQALFGPVAKGPLPAGDLKDHPAYPAMAYMAALTTLQVVDGAPRLDCSVIVGSDAHKPVADFGGIGGRIQRLPSKARSLRLQDEGLKLDMVELPIRNHLRDQSKARARKREEIKTASVKSPTQEVAPVAEPAVEHTAGDPVVAADNS